MSRSVIASIEDASKDMLTVYDLTANVISQPCICVTVVAITYYSAAPLKCHDRSLKDKYPDFEMGLKYIIMGREQRTLSNIN